MVRAMTVVVMGLRWVRFRAIAMVRLRAAARMATRRQGNWRKRSSGAWRQMGAEMGVRRRVMAAARMARAKTVVRFRERYPTLSDDEAVGKDGAPGSVVVRSAMMRVRGVRMIRSRAMVEAVWRTWSWRMASEMRVGSVRPAVVWWKRKLFWMRKPGVR